MTKAEIILMFIRDSEGATLVEIKRFAALLNGHDPSERTSKGKPRWSGYYSTNLLGTMHQYMPGKTPGLLRKYCTKLPHGQWVLTEEIKPPFYRMPVETKSYRSNRARELGERELARKERVVEPDPSAWILCSWCGTPHRRGTPCPLA
jgi:hypothetical protein